MFKKSSRIVILILIFIPLIYVLTIGYPLLSKKEMASRIINNNQLNSSQRCYAINDWNKYVSCMKNSKQFLNGFLLITKLNDELNAMNKGFAAVFFLFLITQLLLVVLIFGSQKDYSTKDENKNAEN